MRFNPERAPQAIPTIVAGIYVMRLMRFNPERAPQAIPTNAMWTSSPSDITVSIPNGLHWPF